MNTEARQCSPMPFQAGNYCQIEPLQNDPDIQVLISSKKKMEETHIVAKPVSNIRSSYTVENIQFHDKITSNRTSSKDYMKEKRSSDLNTKRAKENSISEEQSKNRERYFSQEIGSSARKNNASKISTSTVPTTYNKLFNSVNQNKPASKEAPSRKYELQQNLPNIDPIVLSSNSNPTNFIPGKKSLDETSKVSTGHIQKLGFSRNLQSKSSHSSSDDQNPTNKQRIDPIKPIPRGQWLCDVCKSEAFSSFEEAALHERTCKGVKKKRNLQKERKTSIVVSLLPKDPVVVRPDNFENISKFHSCVLQNIEIFEAVNRVHDMTPNDRLPISEGNHIYRAAYAGDIIGIRCIHCKGKQQSFSNFPLSVSHLCSQTEKEIYRHMAQECACIPIEQKKILHCLYPSRERDLKKILAFCEIFLNRMGIFDLNNKTLELLLDRGYKLDLTHGLIFLGLPRFFTLYPPKKLRQHQPNMIVARKRYPLSGPELGGMETTLSLFHKFTILQLELQENSNGLISIQCKHCRRQRDNLESWKKAPKQVFSMGHSHLVSCKMIPKDLKSYLSVLRNMRKDSGACSIGKYLVHVAKTYNIVEVIGKGVRFQESLSHENVRCKFIQSISKKNSNQNENTPDHLNHLIPSPKLSRVQTSDKKSAPTDALSLESANESAPVSASTVALTTSSLPTRKVQSIKVKPNDPGLPIIDDKLPIKEDLSDFHRYLLKNFDIAMLRGANCLCIRCLYCREKFVMLEKVADFATTIFRAFKHTHKCRLCPKYISTSTTISRLKKGKKGTQGIQTYIGRLMKYYRIKGENKTLIFDKNSSISLMRKILSLDSTPFEVKNGQEAVPIVNEYTSTLARRIDPFFGLSFSCLELFEIDESKCLGIRCANCKVFSMPIRSFHFLKDTIFHAADRHLKECVDTPFFLREKLRDLRDMEKTNQYTSLRKFADLMIEHFNFVELKNTANNSGGGVAFGGVPMTMKSRKEYFEKGIVLDSPRICAPFYDIRAINVASISQYNSISLQQIEIFERNDVEKRVGIRCIHCHANGESFCKTIPTIDSLHRLIHNTIYGHVASCRHMPLKIGMNLRVLQKKQVIKCKKGLRTFCCEVCRVLDLQDMADTDGNSYVAFKNVANNNKRKSLPTFIKEFKIDKNNEVSQPHISIFQENFEEAEINIGDEYQVSEFPKASNAYIENTDDW